MFVTNSPLSPLSNATGECSECTDRHLPQPTT